MIKPSCKYNGGEFRERKRLREWLIDMINSNSVHGLRWINREERTFRITWKHAGKPDFELEKDAVLFREWAKHTGKYKAGEQPDPSTWKTRFRCALHKMPDVEEVKVPHSLDHPTDPFRVFKILPKTKGSQSPKRNSTSPKPGYLKSQGGRIQKEISSAFLPIRDAPFGSYPISQSSYELKGKFFIGNQFSSTADLRSQSNAFPDDRYDDLENITPTIGIGIYDADYAQEVTVSTCTSPPGDTAQALANQTEEQYCFQEKKLQHMNNMQIGNQYSYNFYPTICFQNKPDPYGFASSAGNFQPSADPLKLDLNTLLGLQADM